MSGITTESDFHAKSAANQDFLPAGVRVNGQQAQMHMMNPDSTWKKHLEQP